MLCLHAQFFHRSRFHSLTGRLSTLTFEKITPFLLHLPEDIKSEDLFSSIAQVSLLACTITADLQEQTLTLSKLAVFFVLLPS